MIELLDRLVARLAQLAELRQKRRRGFFTDHVQPLLDDFEALHDSYVLAFTEAHSRIARAADAFAETQAVDRELKQQSQANKSRRARVLAFAQAFKDDKLLDGLVSAICDYLRDTSAAAQRARSTASPVPLEGSRYLLAAEFDGDSPSDLDGDSPSDLALTTYDNRTLLVLENASGDMFAASAIHCLTEDGQSFRLARLHELDRVICDVHGNYHSVQLSAQELKKTLLS